MSSDNSDKDLPLMANVSDIVVQHYIFNLRCSFNDCKFVGYVIMKLEPATCVCLPDSANIKLNPTSVNSESNFDKKTYSHETFKFILDSNNIIVKSVEEIKTTDELEYNNEFFIKNFNSLSVTKLNFLVEEWSLKIMKPNVLCPCKFPKLVKINYETKAEGQSLLWVKDQDCRPVVYTYGAWINNRSLYPCQEPPTAMATWEAYISVEKPAVVLMSGDNLPKVFNNADVLTYYYYTKMILPLSTLALAVGFWEVTNMFDCTQSDSFSTKSIRMCASPSLHSKAVKELSNYIYCAILATESIFGSYPFPRIDFLIVPRGFCSLGMASPNVIFLSQTLLSSDDESMYYKIAHEICHAWFGLLIGALDWTEEWLSEGFATYMEDIIHARAVKMDSCIENQYYEVKAYLRLKTLLSEVRNTDAELQVLRPNKGEIKSDSIDGVNAVILKNGKNTEKAFIQVHYIKGFFLLKYLCDLVGLAEFLKFLNLYISKYKGQLVESTEMLLFFLQTFPEVCNDHNITLEKIVSDWLHAAGVPEALLKFDLPSTNPIFIAAFSEMKKWKSLNSKFLNKASKKRKYDFNKFAQLSSESLLLLLDSLIDENKLSHSTLKFLDEFYHFEKKNAEVRHKWCELIVKHRFRPGYECVKNFLMNDLAMGVYIYGELILNGTPVQKKLAEDCFALIHEEMEPNCLTTIQKMLDIANESSSELSDD